MTKPAATASTKVSNQDPDIMEFMLSVNNSEELTAEVLIFALKQIPPNAHIVSISGYKINDPYIVIHYTLSQGEDQKYSAMVNIHTRDIYHSAVSSSATMVG